MRDDLDWGNICQNAPQDWVGVSLGGVFSERSERGEIALPLLSVTRTGLKSQAETDRRDTSNADKSRYKAVRVGDIAYNTMRMWQGRSAHVLTEGLVSPAYTVLTPKKSLDTSFAAHLLKFPPLVRKFQADSQGLVSDTWNLKFAAFSKIKTLLPPLPEQRKITSILTSVDEAIQATQAVIEQTRRVKEGLAQDLLTRGTGHTRFKQTEIGEVPEGWEIQAVTAFGEVVLGRQKAPKYMTGDCFHPYLRVVNVLDDRLDLSDVAEMDFDGEMFAKYRLRYGDILVTEGDLGSAWNVGRTAIFRGEIEGCCFQNTLIRFRPKNPADAEFFHIAFGSLRAQGFFARRAAATTVFHLSVGRFKTVLVPLPPQKERDEIVQVVSAVDSTIDAGTAKVLALQRTKAGLLQDLLTGRVRVSV